MRWALGLVLGLVAGAGWAQGGDGLSLGAPATLASPVVTLDQDRLFAQSLFGQRVTAELDAAWEELAEENRLLLAGLEADERALTESRPTLAPEEFRARAEAFHERAETTRAEQDAKSRALQRRTDLERQAFLSRVLPILAEVMTEAGAVAILDERAILLAADVVDITDEAVRRIDAELGDGSGLGPPKRAD